MGKMKKALALLSMMVFLSNQGVLYAQTIQTSNLQANITQTNTVQTDILQSGTLSNTINKEQLNKYNLFAIGQIHGMQRNTTLNLELVKCLNQKINLKYVLMDIGYAQSLKLNNYLKTQDEALLDEIMEDMYPEHRTEEMKTFFKDLYAYNQETSTKIELVGVGRDRKENTVEQIEKLFEPYKDKEQIQKDLQLIKMYPSTQVFETLLEDMTNPEGVYGELLDGDTWWRAQLLLESGLEIQKWEKNVTNLMHFTSFYQEEKILYLGNQEEVEKEIIVNFYKKNNNNYADKILNLPCYYEETKLTNGVGIFVEEAKNATPYKYNEVLADSYVKGNTTKVDIQDTKFTGLQCLDKELDKNKIFLSGEVHGNTGSYEMQLYLIKYFHQKAGINIIMTEGCNATGELLNTYIQTGDLKALEQAKTFLKTTLLNTKEYYAFLDALKEYNAQQEEDKKLRIVGIDRVNSLENANAVLQGLFEEHKAQELLDIEKFTPQNRIQVATQIKDILDKNKKNYLEAWGKEDYFVVEMLTENLMLDEQRVSDAELIREHSFINVFNKVLEYYEGEKIFAQMGLFHASQEFKNYEGEGYTVAEYLQKYNPTTKGQVISILYDYEKGEHSKINSPDKVFFDFKYPDILKRYAISDYQILDLAQQNNPLEHLYVTMNDNYITDTFQYYILMKSTKATQPVDLP